MSNQFKAKARVIGHIVSAATWIWAIVKLFATGNWRGFLQQAVIGVAGHVLTEKAFG